MLALADPLRREVAQAVATCRRAGIRVLMITGDHPRTAQAIARQAGLDASRVVTGEKLEAGNAADLARLAGEASVFARMRPRQKLALVQALKARGEVVAMTGDGVNDAPALKAAHIGIAMGQRGTVMGLYAWMHASATLAPLVLAAAFTALAAANAGLILPSRAGGRRRARLFTGLSGMSCLVVAATGVPAVALLFGFAALPPGLWLGCVAAGLLMAVPFELARRWLGPERHGGLALARRG